MESVVQQTYSMSVSRLTIGCLGILTNILQIVLISRNKDKRTVFTMTLSSLNIADLMSTIMVSSVACSGILRFVNIAFDEWFHFFGIVGLKFSFVASCFHVLYIGIQRFCVVIFPLRFKLTFTLFRCRITLISIWFLCAAIRTFFGVFPTIVCAICSYIVMAECVTLVLLYSWLCYKMQVHQHEGRVQRINDRKKNARLFIHSIAVLSAFLLCRLPIALVFVSPSRIFGITGYQIGLTMSALNPVLDSLVYFLCIYCSNNELLIASTKGRRTEIQKHTVSLANTRNQQVTDCKTTAL